MKVYFDESGNTGPALLDKNQPAFILASNNLSRIEAENLLSLVYSTQIKEAKFSKLKKTETGISKLESFFKRKRFFLSLLVGIIYIILYHFFIKRGMI